jgi:RNA polymerase sigma-70 factor (ECF subfamily)
MSAFRLTSVSIEQRKARDSNVRAAIPGIVEPQEPDALLVRRAKQGDTDAFSALYWRYVDGVYGLAFRRLGNRAQAEDATQTVFMRAIAALPTCHDERAFGGWLFAIARNVTIDTLRERRISFTSVEGWDAIDPERSPEDRALALADCDALHEARANCLSDQERELFDLLLADLNDKEIAAALGKRHGAVRTAHWRLLKRLRTCLGLSSGRKEASDATPPA